jgi:tRNA A-37 threonylcarbamoyl transferase component Bud32
VQKSAYTGPSLSRYHFEGLTNKGWIIEKATEVYKRQPNVVALMEFEIGNRFRKVVVKCFGWRNTISAIMSPFMRSRAQKSWDASWWLLEAGVPVPKPIAVFTNRSRGFVKSNFLITEYIGTNQKVRRILRNEIVEAEQKNLILRKMAEMVRKMHQAGMIHRDLTPGNFLVKDSNCEEIYLVDLNRLRRKSRVTVAGKMHDISKMGLCTCNLEHFHENCKWQYFLRQYEPEQFNRNLKALKRAIRRTRVHRKVKKLKKINEKK